MRILRKIRYIFKKQRRYALRALDKFVQFIADVLYDRKNTFTAKIIGAILLPFSFIFTLIVKLRIWFYGKHYLRSQPLGCHVIVVGNITMGGTGKTPVAEYLAKLLRAMGRRPAIISRGYKSKGEPSYRKFFRWLTHSPDKPPKVVSDGENVLLDSELAGDEPFMLAKNLKGVPVVVDKDRVKAGRYAIRRLGADVLILDDGYQYLRLRSSLRLALVDKSNPFGNHYLLPRGILREPLAHLDRASCILLTKSDGREDRALEEKIRRVNGGAQIVECCHKPCYFVVHSTGEVRPLEVLRGRKVAIFCAIASPEGFERFILSLGAHIIYKKRYIDHHRFTHSELSRINERSQGADFLVTTEKDAVRIAGDFQFSLPFFYMRVEVQFLRNGEWVREILRRTLESVKNREKMQK
ncbi:MAG: tetraacyldisaccharide 4'-kinase [Puniceicoccales bacterium]|jgi:tetraacyldisaccharide 4'-kinase|nr:tetraacyldisaccharide 4'-kinase [Puniceicoccales bacterium]